jgi:hypothetical protein
MLSLKQKTMRVGGLAFANNNNPAWNVYRHTVLSGVCLL